jgi:hypothetical protein
MRLSAIIARAQGDEHWVRNLITLRIAHLQEPSYGEKVFPTIIRFLEVEKYSTALQSVRNAAARYLLMDRSRETAYDLYLHKVAIDLLLEASDASFSREELLAHIEDSVLKVNVKV